MFNSVLRERGNNRMVYSTSIGFRIVFLGIALFIILSIASVSEGSFFAQLNVVVLTIIGVCLFAALYLERWIFDKDANLFEKNVGILLFYSHKKRPLDTLQKVVLNEPVRSYGEKPILLRQMSRRSVLLSIVDRDGKVYGLDMAKGASVREAKRSAERLSAFCGIPLEDNLINSSAETYL